MQLIVLASWGDIFIVAGVLLLFGGVLGLVLRVASFAKETKSKRGR